MQEVATVVQRLFRGYFSYVTTCCNCQQPSEGSKRKTEYYELPVQVVGMKTLQQSMVRQHAVHSAAAVPRLSLISLYSKFAN